MERIINKCQKREQVKFRKHSTFPVLLTLHAYEANSKYYTSQYSLVAVQSQFLRTCCYPKVISLLVLQKGYRTEWSVLVYVMKLLHLHNIAIRHIISTWFCVILVRFILPDLNLFFSVQNRETMDFIQLSERKYSCPFEIA